MTLDPCSCCTAPRRAFTRGTAGGSRGSGMATTSSPPRKRSISTRLTALVESLSLRCTHYDAFRFFTPDAVPLNRTALVRLEQAENDQSGCIHANMDLYKFAFNSAPFFPAELTADCFELAIAAREIDMRASPYDLRSFGYEPIQIETREGREEYVLKQREIAERAIPLRIRLLNHYRALREALT